VTFRVACLKVTKNGAISNGLLQFSKVNTGVQRAVNVLLMSFKSSQTFKQWHMAINIVLKHLIFIIIFSFFISSFCHSLYFSFRIVITAVHHQETLGKSFTHEYSYIIDLFWNIEQKTYEPITESLSKEFDSTYNL
jgi:hypothetical protein